MPGYEVVTHLRFNRPGALVCEYERRRFRWLWLARLFAGPPIKLQPYNVVRLTTIVPVSD